LSSTAGALPEVAGHAALAVDPYDIDAMVESIRRLDRDAALRTRLATDGPVQAAKFSPTAFAERVRQLYQIVGAR
jgi:glycosyltransferase involved in cell wall biosynthesis